MKSYLKYIFISCFFLSNNVFENTLAQNFNHDEIQIVVQNFLSDKFSNEDNLSKEVILNTRKIDIINSTEAIGFISHLSPKGFIVISNNKNLPPVIAYSLIHNWNEDNINSNSFFQLLKNDLDNRIDNIDDLPPGVQKRNEDLWNYYLNSSRSTTDNFQQWPEDGTTSTGGWISSTWKQTEPYNQSCPIDPTTNNRSVIGCGALAVAQIVNFHKYFNNKRFYDNDKYISGNSINIDDDSQILDFPSFNQLNLKLDTLQHKYDNNLPLSNRDYAALCFASGIMTNIEYSSIESPTVPAELYNAFLNDMEYSSAESSSIMEDFFLQLKGNMKNGLPAILLLSRGLEGHAAVCDGYNSDGFYHINFGWGANSPEAITDCWYYLDETLPYNFVLSSGIINIKPGIDESTLISIPDSIIKFEPILVNTKTEVKTCKLRNQGSSVIYIDQIKVPNYFKISLDESNYGNYFKGLSINPMSQLELYIHSTPDSVGKFEGILEIIISQGYSNRYKHIELQSFGKPEIGTIITENSISGIWEKTSSPYIIVDDIYIKQNEELRILPGTTIKLLNDCDFVIGENSKLTAKGTETDSIYFTSFNTMVGCNRITFNLSDDDDSLELCVFSYMGNTELNGGAINIDSADITITNSNFRYNKANNGGAIYSTNSSFKVTNSVFSNNIATSGGAIYLTDSNPKVENSTFELNYSEYGGAIYLWSSSPILQHLVFKYNTTNIYGGAIYMKSSAPACENLSFNKNTSKESGGAIYFNGSAPKIKFSNFYNNISGASGGIFYSKDSDFLIKNSICDSNLAQSGGSLFASTKSTIFLQNITAINHDGNLFTDLISIHEKNNIQIKNSIIWNAKKTPKSSLTKKNIGQYSISRISSDTIGFYYNNIDSVLLQELKEINYNIVVLDQYYNSALTPQFIDYQNKNYKLLDKSPCIDGGDPSDDFSDEPFPNGYCVNLGAYGGTQDATKTTDSVVTVSPNPIIFGESESIDTKEIIVKIKNGTLYDLIISDISLEDSSYFQIVDFDSINGSQLASGDIDSINIIFYPPDVGEGSFNTALFVKTSTYTKSIPIFASLYEGILIGGNISGVLTKGQGPYTVTENLTISESLIIEPGVHLRFEENCGIDVVPNGRLVAIGNENDSIKFSARNPELGWDGIEIRDSGEDDTLRYCIIQESNYKYINRMAGIWLINSNPNISRIRFFKNYGYACVIENARKPVIISNCQFDHNFRGMYGRFSSIDLINTTFYNNYSSCIYFIGGLNFYNPQNPHKFRMFNVTASGNHSYYSVFQFDYAQTFHDSTHIYIKNSILDKNRSEFDYILSVHSANISIEYSNIDTSSNNWFISRKVLDHNVGSLDWEEGNTSTDPLFVDPDNGDFSFQPNSPCIDSGNPNEIYNDIEDPLKPGYALWPAMGTLRNDMGAYGGGAYDYLTSLNEIKENENIPSSYSLLQNYPNPFNPVTTIKYRIPERVNSKKSDVIPSGVDGWKTILKIYDILGREVTTLVNEKQKPGNYVVSWNASNFSSGIYFYKITSGDFVSTRKMILLK